jgi:Lon protease-like protein
MRAARADVATARARATGDARRRRARRATREASRRATTRATRATGANDGDGDGDDDGDGARGGGYLDYSAAMAKEFVEVEVPALLFPRRETLLPGSRLTLHLYEARFLALLEDAMKRTGGLIAQLTFLPSESSEEEGLTVNASATLARIETVTREAVGARVDVVGEARVKLEGIAGREPFITGVFTHVPQMGDAGTYVPSDAELAQVKEVTDYIEGAVRDVLLLSARLLGDAPSDTDVESAESDAKDEDADDENTVNEFDDASFEGIWTHKEVGDLRSAMAWVDAPSVTVERIEAEVTMEDADWTTVPEGFAHSPLTRAERLSFAVLQVAPASTPTDLQKLIACRAVAMSTDHGLMDRLRLGVSVLDDQLQTLRAKVALKSLGNSINS